jgi:hypothetical protein
MIRLTSELWVQSYLTRLRLKEIPAFITLKGDLTAGTIFVKINTLDGFASAYHKTFDLNLDKRCWQLLLLGKELEVDKKLEKEKRFDPDIWVIEVEDKQGRHLLDELGLKD